jgi:hypothetical protein
MQSLESQKLKDHPAIKPDPRRSVDIQISHMFRNDAEDSVPGILNERLVAGIPAYGEEAPDQDVLARLFKYAIRAIVSDDCAMRS